MKREKTLEEFFLAIKPTFDDQDKFMHELEFRLDLVEQFKAREQATLRQYRYAMVAVLLLGTLIGGIVSYLQFPMSLTFSLFRMHTISELLPVLVSHTGPILESIMLMMFVCLGMIGFVFNILEIKDIRAK